MKHAPLLWLVAAGLGAAAAPAGAPDRAHPLSALPEATQRAIGLHKLNDAEQTALLGLIAGVAATHLDRTARDQMQREGWEVVQVLATREVKMNDWDVLDTECIIVKVGWRTWAVESPGFRAWSPGEYWARPSAFNGLSEIIDQFGSEHRCTLSRSKEL